MRKITFEASKAFYNFEKYNKSNTKVLIKNWVSKLYLFWNLIAEWNWKGLAISNCGRQSNTTKDRLNWLLDYKMRVYQKNYTWYLSSWDNEIEFKEWNSLNWVYIF
jgi:hypothetical protein